MTALQSIIKEAKSLKKQYPKRYAKWTDYVKQASAIYASKHKGKSPVGKKRKVGAAKPVSKHKDTKSHNVNIRVVSGVGALPIGFKGSILGVNFKVINQFDIYNNVSAIIEDIKNGSTIAVIDGTTNFKNKVDQFESYIKNHSTIDKRDFPKDLKNRIDKFVSNLNKEVKQYNSGKKSTTKKKPLIIKKSAKKIVKSKNTLTKVKEVLKQDKKRLKHGYSLTSGNVRIGSIDQHTLKHYEDVVKKINIFEKQLQNHIVALKNKKNSVYDKMVFKKQLISIKKYLKELKTQKSELKKLI